MADIDKHSRRRILKSAGILGVGSTVGLAGCLGEDDPDPDDPDPDDPDPDDPDPVDPDDDFPSRTIEMLVSFSPGGGMDAYARLLMAHLPKHLPNEVDTVVRNVTGGGGRTGRNTGLNAPPDGYTLHHTHLENAAVQQLTFDVQYDLREITTLGSMARAGKSWSGRADTLEEYPDWDSLVEGLASGDVTVATQGFGGTAHIVTAAYGQLGGQFDFTEVNYVHYDGTGPSIPGLLRGDAHVTSGTTDSYVPFVEEEDDLEMYFVADADEDRYPRDVDFGVPQELAEQTRTLLTNQRLVTAPPGVPENRVRILREAIWDTLHDDEFLEAADAAGRPVIPTHGDETDALASGMLELWQDNIDIIEALSE